MSYFCRLGNTATRWQLLAGLMCSCGAGGQTQSFEEERALEVVASEPSDGAPTAVEPVAESPSETFLGVVDSSSVPEVSTDTACSSTQVKAALVREPVDIVMVVDNSGSMSEELEALERSLNDDFARVLARAGTDYRLVLITNHRTSQRGQQRSVCIEAPLSGVQSCRDAAVPVFSERFFQYSALVQSDESLAVLLDTFAPPFAGELHEDQFGLAPKGWSDWVRPGVPKVIVEITDDESRLEVAPFLASFQTLQPDSFDENGDPLFVFHSVVGLRGKADPAEAYLPEEPLQEGSCDQAGLTGVASGQIYQELSRLTGGLRFSICNVESFEKVFQNIAGDVVVSSGLDCEFDFPAAPDGRAVDPDRIALSVASAGVEETFQQVLSADSCGESSFYLEGDQILLCPQACEAIRLDPQAQVDVLFACEDQIVR